MARIDIRRRHALGQEKARIAVDTIAAKLGESLSLHYEWEGDSLCFKREGAKGEIDVSEDEVHIKVRLGLFLSPMKGVFEKEIQRYLDEHLQA